MFDLADLHPPCVNPGNATGRSFILKKKEMEKVRFGRFPYIPLAMVSSYFVSVLGRETLEDHSQLPKKANKCSVRAVASFSYVWRHRHVRVIPT